MHTEWRRDQLSWTAESFHCLPFNSSALYYLQTPTRRYGHASMPPQFLPISGHSNVSFLLSLEWHVWSSSSRNNCHAVHRSLSSGASLCSGTENFFLSCLILSAKLYFTQSHFDGQMHLPPSPSSTMSIGQGDIPIIILLILSSAGWSCYQYPPIHGTCGHDDIPAITPILSMYLSTTSAVFTPAGHVNILQLNCEMLSLPDTLWVLLASFASCLEARPPRNPWLYGF